MAAKNAVELCLYIRISFSLIPNRTELCMCVCYICMCMRVSIYPHLYIYIDIDSG